LRIVGPSPAPFHISRPPCTPILEHPPAFASLPFPPISTRPPLICLFFFFSSFFVNPTCAISPFLYGLGATLAVGRLFPVFSPFFAFFLINFLLPCHTLTLSPKFSFFCFFLTFFFKHVFSSDPPSPPQSGPKDPLSL